MLGALPAVGYDEVVTDREVVGEHDAGRDGCPVARGQQQGDEPVGEAVVAGSGMFLRWWLRGALMRGGAGVGGYRDGGRAARDEYFRQARASPVT